ncbi:heat shock protein beta-2-like [Acanthaster planci]|uniref:Heat shock protein beta-2-like n=1 Tax=Acanthaster planci TaxID=133434 RepID=A0A8B7XIM5_ACAPL|nr:heat shock protein beta-2-like [Acanthaster planci]
MNIEIKIPLTHPRVEYSITGGDGASHPIIVSSVPASSKPMITRQVYTTGNPQQTTVESATMRTSSGQRVEVNVQPSAPTKPTLYQGYYVTSPQPTIISSPTESSSSSQPNFTTKIISPPSNQAEPARQSSRVECDEHRFMVTLDVSEYRPEDVEVKVKDNKLTVHAEQREGNTATGYVQREYYRQYTLPEDVDISRVKCYLSEKKILTVEIPRVPLTDTRERQIPIMMMDGNRNATGGGKRAYFVEEMNTSDVDSHRK